MAYDRELAQRVREVLGPVRVDEKAMFGGLGFLLDGRLAVAAGSRGVLMVRVDPAEAERLLDEPGVSPVEMRGRTVRGWVDVQPDVLDDDDRLRAWVQRGLDYAGSLPA